MATSSRKRVRYTFDVHFVDQEEKKVFVERLKKGREQLSPPGSPSLDNFSVMNTLFSFVEADCGSQPSPAASSATAVQSFMRNSGKQ